MNVAHRVEVAPMQPLDFRNMSDAAPHLPHMPSYILASLPNDCLYISPNSYFILQDLA